MDKALLVIAALIISGLLGISWSWKHRAIKLLHLSSLFDLPAHLLRNSERKLNRENRSPEDLQFRGTFLTSLVLLGSTLVGFIFSLFHNHVFTLLVLVLFLPAGGSWFRAANIKKYLQSGNIQAARQQLEGTVFRHHAILETPAVARAAIEYLAVQFSQKIVAPIFWFMLLGMAGLFLSVASVLLQETLACGGGKPSNFGKAAYYTDMVLNYIPARLAAFLWLLSLLFLAGNNWQAVSNKISAGILNSSPTRLALLCTASCLNLSLGSKTSAYYNEGWIGDGNTEATTSDITRAQFLFMICCSLIFVGLGFFV